MHPNRRRKKRPNYGIRTVEVVRGPNGFGFTISGQQPCILSCIVSNSPADQAGLRAGDFLISVNGVSVSKITHDAVVGLIGNCVSPIKMTIAENYYSDSSDEEIDCGRIVNSRKPKYVHKPRQRAHKADLRRAAVETNEKNMVKMRECFSKQPVNDSRHNANVFHEEPINGALNVSNPLPMEDEAGPIEYKALVGYLGTIEMPKELLPSSRLQTVCSCIRKLRQEKRTPTAVLMTILPTCLTLKNASNHILAIYPTNRVVYIGSTADRESRYFGLVTSAVCDTRSENLQKRYEDSYQQNEKKLNNTDSGVEISNSCHVFVTDPKIVDHNVHQNKAESFKITCTTDPVTGNCLEFPGNALYIVSLVQNMYKLQNNDGSRNNDNLGPLVANSPQPSASSNSDSGIGFRDDCGNISDRILVVEFPMHRPLPLLNNNNRPSGIDASNIPLEGLDNVPLNNDQAQSLEMNNVRPPNTLILDRQNNLSKTDGNDKNADKQFNNLNNIRACEGVNIKNIEKNEIFFKNDCVNKQNSDTDHYVDYDRLTCRAMLDACVKLQRGLSPSSVLSSDDNTRNADIDSGQIYSERAVDVPADNSPSKKSYECVSLNSANDDPDFKSSTDNVSMHSSKSIELANLINIFKAPFESKRTKRHLKMVSSCDNLDKYNENIMNYKLSPKVYGLSKPNYSCEELNNFDSVEKYGYGSLQDLYSWNEHNQTRRNVAQSEPDVRIPRNVGDNLCDQNGVAKCNNTEGPAGWASSLEKLLEDPLGLHAFAEFLKKEFSAENIYFWTACERYRKLPPGNERVKEAERIYHQHLSVGAPEAVNVDAHGRQCAEQGLKNPTSNLFDQAQKQIFNLMKFDSYPRFLKSDIYKQCLSGEIEKPSLDIGLMLQTPTSTPSKLKKSLSNAEDRRRKSLLPWHRKNRSKSKDRGEIEYTHKQNDIIACNENVDDQCGQGIKGGDLYSSHSSLTSLDLAITNQDITKPILTNQDESNVNGTRTALCRVLLSNGSTTVVQIKESETIQQLVTRLLDKRGLTYSSFEVFIGKPAKPLDVSEPSTKLAGCEVTVEQRVVFKLDLPNRKIISVKSKYTKIIVDVLRPILHKYQYNLDQVVVTNGNNLIDLHLPVTSIDGARLNVQLLEDIKNDKTNTVLRINNIKATKRDEITNKVFEGILQEKADAVTFKPTKSDKGSVKSEDWGSEHSSGIIGKFLRRDSGVHERRKKLIGPRFKGPNSGSMEDVENEQNQIKKPLIAKWKAGANKLHVTCSESDELVEGLTRAQRCRLEDQRGTEINFELPDFLKDKENEHNFHKPLRKTNETENNSRFYLGETGIHSKLERSVMPPSKKLEMHSNYENRSDLIANESARLNRLISNQAQPSSRVINSRVMSPNNLSSEESAQSNQSTPSKCSSLENTVIENKTSNRTSDPPPLPPKPKIVPIKPPNWGQLNGFPKNISLSNDKNQAMFLEQPSSSFV